MKRFGLIGDKLSHSFSKTYFQEKFKRENLIGYEYHNFEIDDISMLKNIIIKNNLSGINITIPYKERVIPFLDTLTNEAEIIGAVNTIQIVRNKLIGHNTDIYGFTKSFIPLIKKRKNALILGDGGASKCIQLVMKKNNINFIIASRNSKFSIDNILETHINNHNIIINTTPLGMYPNTQTCPNIPYHAISSKHLVFDLIYNPEESLFLKKAKLNKAETKNGAEMLYLQAEKSWKIWN
tara:strand:+ start:100 stop:813 length:714 start_codon:yes stop_codon:yes gene_type:complete